jgi:hypothetical protein
VGKHNGSLCIALDIIQMQQLLSADSQPVVTWPGGLHRCYCSTVTHLLFINTYFLELVFYVHML